MNRREEIILREYIRAELNSTRLDEGMIQDVMAKVIAGINSKIDSLLMKLEGLDELRYAVLETLADNGGTGIISQASALGGEIRSAADELKASVPQDGSSAPKQESISHLRYRTIAVRRNQRLINESIDPITILGIAIATPGILALFFKGCHKIAEKFANMFPKSKKIKKASSAFESAYHTMHHVEEVMMDWFFPDALLYKIYVAIKDYKGETPLSREEFQKSPDKKKYDKGAFAVMLIPLLIYSLSTLKHALTHLSALSAAEAAAVGEKSYVIAGQAAEHLPVIGAEIATGVSTLLRGAATV